MYIEEKDGRIIEHYTMSEIDKIKLPDELLKSFARSLVPELQAYIRAKREQEQADKSINT